MIFMAPSWNGREIRQQRSEMGSAFPMARRLSSMSQRSRWLFLEEPVIWDDEQIQIVFLLGFKMNTRDEIHRIQLFYKEYVSLIDTEEKIKMLRNRAS